MEPVDELIRVAKIATLLLQAGEHPARDAVATSSPLPSPLPDNVIPFRKTRYPQQFS
jgi:hypothetical protein